MEIKKVYKESVPAVKLVGKRFVKEGMEEGVTFASGWRQAFQDGWFDVLGACKGIPGVSGDHLGAMRLIGEGGAFEYWIGMFLAPDAVVPEGFEGVDIPAGELGVCWLYGNDKSGDLYSPEASERAMGAMAEQGWRFDEVGWFLERYNGPRFTRPDEDGNVILDICAYLVSQES